MTEIEKIILEKTGWHNSDNFGLMVFDIKTPKGKEIAHIISEFSHEEIKIRYAFPNIKGEKINVSFNRSTQQLNEKKTDKEIFENSDLSDFLVMIDTLVKKSNGMYYEKIKTVKSKEIK